MSTKIKTTQEAQELSKQVPMVFTSGVFDILHIGHVIFFEEIKRLLPNHKLIVAIHTDKWVQKIKGPNRPYMTTKERSHMLAALEAVDFVVEWDGWEDIVGFAQALNVEYFAVTQKSYDHTQKGEWSGPSWDQIAESTGKKIIKIPIYQKFSSSKFAHLFE